MAMKGYWHRFQRQRITRRRLLAVTGAGAAGLALVAACGDGGGGGDATPGAGAPVRGGRYVFTTTGDWGTIDPVTSVAFGPGIFPRLYNVLVEQSRQDPNFFFADLAAALPEQPDAETFIYTIRPGVKIAPNDLGIPERDLDAMDAQAWLERITQEENAVHRAFTNQWLQSFEAPDAQTFQVKTNGPYVYFLPRLGAPLGGTMPPREFFEQDISLAGQGIGAGPFKIQAGSFKESGEVIVERNPNYYGTDEATGEQLPYVDEIQAVRIDDRQARRASFISDQIDVYGAETGGEADEIAGQKAGVQIFEDPSNTFIAFTMNPTKPPWNDEKIRKAAMFALNRQEYVDIIVGPDGGQPNGLVHWSMGDFALPPDELEQLQPFDPQMSRQLIQGAGQEVPFRIKVMYPVSDIEFHDQHLPIWRQQMEAAGFELDEEPLEFGAWVGRYLQVDYDSSLSLNQIYETPEIPLDFHAAMGPQGDGNFALGIGTLFPEIEQAITESKQATSLEDQVERVREAQRMLYDKGPAFLPIMTWVAFTLRQAKVKNWPRGIGASELYLNDWWLDSAT